MKNAEIHLPYYKQGDDFSHCLENSETLEEALESHASMLEASASILRGIKDIVASKKDVKIDGDTHIIFINGPDNVIDALIEKEYAVEDDFDDEEFDDDELEEE